MNREQELTTSLIEVREMRAEIKTVVDEVMDRLASADGAGVAPVRLDQAAVLIAAAVAWMAESERVDRVVAVLRRCRCAEPDPLNEWDGREPSCPLHGNDQARHWAADVAAALGDPW